MVKKLEGKIRARKLKKIPITQELAERLDRELPPGVHACLTCIYVPINASRGRIKKGWDEAIKTAVKLAKEHLAQDRADYPEKFADETKE